MLDANSLRKNSREKIIESIIEKIEEKIKRVNEEGGNKIGYGVERNGWFNCDLGIEEISWGVIIKDIINYFNNNNFKVRLRDSYGTVSYTKILKIEW